MNTTNFAQNELDLLIDQIVQRDPEDEMSIHMQKKMNNNLIEIISLIEKQGHSGFSMGYLKNTLNKLLDNKPLSPLTGEDHEWVDVSCEDEEKPRYQNLRFFEVFKDGHNGKPYWAFGKQFTKDNGKTWFTTKDSRVDIEFPFDASTAIPEKVFLSEDKNENN